MIVSSSWMFVRGIHSTCTFLFRSTFPFLSLSLNLRVSREQTRTRDILFSEKESLRRKCSRSSQWLVWGQVGLWPRNDQCATITILNWTHWLLETIKLLSLKPALLLEAAAFLCRKSNFEWLKRTTYPVDRLLLLWVWCLPKINSDCKSLFVAVLSTHTHCNHRLWN